jgi:hypothetical protein
MLGFGRYCTIPSPSTCVGAIQKCRVADPHRFKADTDPDPVSRSGFDDLKLKKIYSWKY